MNTKKLTYTAALAVAIGCAVISVMAVKRQVAAQEVARQRPALQRAPEPPPPEATPPAVPVAPPVEETVPAPHVQPPKASSIAAQPPPAPLIAPAPANAPADQDPLAREALSLVGADPAATAYWTTAINNPDLPAKERKNLIEDLNEDGLSDPSNPGLQDLPLILSRIRLIEHLSPDAMDQVNADAFDEAYNDLINMVSDLTGQ